MTDSRVDDWTPEAKDRLLAIVMVELLLMADLIDDLYAWLTNLTGTPESDVLDAARAVMARYKTRHAVTR